LDNPPSIASQFLETNKPLLLLNIMSANVGLNTPRGSGTSGYVQRNLSYIKPRAAGAGAPYNPDDFAKHKQRQPDAEILEHDRKRRIEVKVFELRDRLEDEGVDEDDIDDQVAEYRKKLEAEEGKNQGRGTDARGLKGYQVHDLAKAKMEETEKMRRAFKISDNYEEGSHWKRDEKKRLDAGFEKEKAERKDREDEELARRRRQDSEVDDEEEKDEDEDDE
jgi:hypothetical protein